MEARYRFSGSGSGDGIETGKTADAADADAILDAEMQTPDEGVESPGREIREMLKNHDEPLEEWKD